VLVLDHGAEPVGPHVVRDLVEALLRQGELLVESADLAVVGRERERHFVLVARTVTPSGRDSLIGW
jgi:hypothetical protein